MWVLDYKQRWVLKNLCFWTVVLEKTPESPLDCKEIKPVNPSQSCIFIGRTDAEAPILWPPDVKNWLIGKDPDAAKDWRQEDQEMTEGEMVGCHHWLNRHEFEQAPWVGDARGKSGVLQLQRVAKSWTSLRDWTELIWSCCSVAKLFLTLCDLMDFSSPGSSPGVCSKSSPLNQWYHLTVLSSAISSSFCLQVLSQHQGLFQWVSSHIRWPKYWSFSFSIISPSNECSGLNPLGLTGLIPLQSKKLSSLL